MVDWPGPIRTLRGRLPTELRLLRGAAGFLGGLLLVFGVFVVLLGGNWRLGYTHEWLLTTIFGLFIAAGVGILSPLWYWIGRPIWFRIDRPGRQFVGRWEAAKFLPGLLGSLIGAGLFFLVSATSGFWVQTLIPFGLAIGLVSPLWFWVFRPFVGHRLPNFPFIDADLPSPAALAVSVLPTVAVLFGVGVIVTWVIALPIVGVGQPVSADGVTVSVLDTRTTTEVTELEGRSVRATHEWRLLLVRLVVDNEGTSPRPLAGRSVGDIALIAPEGGANNFGGPANNWNEAYLDGDFRADGVEYANYSERQESAGGTLAAGDRVSGWLVFRIESPPTGPPTFDAMVIVDDVGRWRLGDDWRT